MTQPLAKRFPTPSIDSLPDDIRTRILAVQEKSGFVPNVFLTLAHRPDEFRAFFAYHDALMDKDSGLTKAEPVGWVERSDTHLVVQQGDGFRKGLTHPTGLLARQFLAQFDT
jgi:hypothetical protein